MIDKLKRYGLFLCPLDNGDWLVGIGSYIYSLRIGQDHYKDKYLSVAHTPEEAIDNFVARIESEEIYPDIKFRLKRQERENQRW